MNPAAESEYVKRLKIERQAVETLYQAFSDNNPDLVDSVLAPSWEDIRMLAQAFPDVQIVVHDMIQEPGRIAARAEISGTHLGEIFGIAPTGKKVSFRLHEFHALEDGRLITTWHMEDWFGLFLQLGQFPPQA